MPGARKARKGMTGVGADAQARKPSGAPTGPDKYDGRSNMNTGEPSPNNPPDRDDKAQVTKTY